MPSACACCSSAARSGSSPMMRQVACRPLRVQSGHHVEHHADPLVLDQPADDDQVGGVGFRVGGADRAEVDPVRHRGDRGIAPQHLAQPLCRLRRRGDDRVRQPHGQPLHRPGGPAGRAQVLPPVRPAPHLMPGDGERLPLERGHQAEHEQLEVGDLVGLQHVEPAAQQAQAGQGEPGRLPDRAAAMPVQRVQPGDGMVGDPTLAAHRRAVPPLHGVDVHVGLVGQPGQQFLVPQFPAAARVRVDHVAYHRDHRALAHQFSAVAGGR